MAEVITNFPELIEVPVIGDTSTTGFAKEFRGDVYTSRGRFGNGSTYVDISATSIKSSNFVSGSLGWRIKYNGDVEFDSGIFRGDIVGATITGGIFQTSTSGQRIVISSDELKDIRLFPGRYKITIMSRNLGKLLDRSEYLVVANKSLDIEKQFERKRSEKRALFFYFLFVIVPLVSILIYLIYAIESSSF